MKLMYVLLLGLVACMAASPLNAQAPAVQAPPPPMTIKLGDVDLKVGGYVDAVGFVRSTTVGSGLGTAFGAIPLAESPAGNLRETRITAQSSRFNVLATSRLGNTDVRGYLEIDFVGVQPPNAMVTTNANGPRMRHSYMQFRTGRFEFMGGQGWSLMTPHRQGMSATPSDIFFTQAIDQNSNVGMTWLRTGQFRFVAHATKSVTAGVSLENPQQYVGSSVVLPAGFPAGEVDNNINGAIPNSYPDVIGKVAFDPQTGSTHQHIEVAVLARGFKTFDPATSSTFSKTGWGASINVNFEPVRNVHLVGTSFTSEGGGRYAIGLGPDFIVKKDGSPSLVTSRSYLAGIEGVIRNATLFGYYGAVRVDREVTTDRDGRLIGYGVPGATGANRDVQEATVGVNYTLWRDPRRGALQAITQYSHVRRRPWSPPAGTEPDARLHMIFVAMRYALP